MLYLLSSFGLFILLLFEDSSAITAAVAKFRERIHPKCVSDTGNSFHDDELCGHGTSTVITYSSSLVIQLILWNSSKRLFKTSGRERAVSVRCRELHPSNKIVVG